MNKGVEAGPIRLNGGNHNLRSLVERDGIHCLGERHDEPTSGLTSDEKEQYRVMLRRLGVPKRDAKKEVGRVETAQPAVGTIREVVREFASLIKPQSKSFSRAEPIRVGEEVAVFERKS